MKVYCCLIVRAALIDFQFKPLWRGAGGRHIAAFRRGDFYLSQNLIKKYVRVELSFANSLQFST